MTETLTTDTPDSLAEAIERAAGLLRDGGLVVVPTETVYGLAANALRADAVRRIFAAKGRPARNPLIVHVASLAMARGCVAAWTDEAERLAAAFWPGPLTLVLARSDRIPDEVTAGGDTVALRWPSHPFVQALIRACGFPLAAPSANPSNALSPTLAAHAAQGLAGRVELVVDGGPCEVGIESTVVDLTTTPPRILRPGIVDEEALAAVLDAVEAGGRASPDGRLRSPGQLGRHYSPRARVLVWSWNDGEDLGPRLREAGIDAGSAHVLAWKNTPRAGLAARIHRMPGEAAPFARALYAELHRCDALGAEAIVVEAVPTAAPWRAVADRLARASFPGGRD